MTDQTEKMQAFLDRIPEEFAVGEFGIDIAVHQEYLDYSRSYTRRDLSELSTQNIGEILFDPNIENIQKKIALIQLAHDGTISAFRQIQKFRETAEDDELHDWTLLALTECQVLLKSQLLEENQGIILTGLGGVGNTLRYYFLVLPRKERPFTETEKTVVREEFQVVSRHRNSTIEAVDVSEHYVGFTILIPIDVAVGTVIEQGITQCNSLGKSFVLAHYFVTNQRIPTAEELELIIHKVRYE